MKHQKNEFCSEVFAHRGFHVNYPENTLKAYERAVCQEFSIEIDIRILKCNTIVCFHDSYMKRLLAVPGKIAHRTYDEIMSYSVLGTESKVPTLEEALNLINGRVTVLIEIKGLLHENYVNALKKILKNYKGRVLFHTTNFLTYLRAKSIWGKSVYYVLNPFRKRFEFVKEKHYKRIAAVPALDDVIVEAEDSAATVIKKLWSTCNKYSSKVDSNHWLISYNGKKNQIQHRGIVSADLEEHSKEAFLKCIELDKIIEFDVMRNEGKLVCYHDDSITAKMGQKASISKKSEFNSSMEFHEILKLIDGKVPVIIDIKDFKLFDRTLEDEIMKILSEYNGKYVVQSFNPLAIMHFDKHYKNVVKGQVGHSLSGVKKFRKVLLTIVNFCLFYRGRPDFIVYDLDPTVYLLSKFNNILGLPVIGYTITSKSDIEAYSNFFNNFICEGDFNE